MGAWLSDWAMTATLALAGASPQPVAAAADDAGFVQTPVNEAPKSSSRPGDGSAAANPGDIVEQPVDAAKTPASAAPSIDPFGFLKNVQRNQAFFGDLWCLRPFLAEGGATLTVQEQSEVLGNLTGGTSRGAAYEGLTTGTFQLDASRAFGLAAWSTPIRRPKRSATNSSSARASTPSFDGRQEDFDMATRTLLRTLAACLALAAAPAGAESALQGYRHIFAVASTITENGDLNPYAVFVAPVSSGIIHQGDVIVDNFNNVSNLQGTGGTIVLVDPQTRAARLFAKLPQSLPQCPGGVGLTAALAMLKSGWVIVGSAPSTDGTTSTKGPGCLLVFDSNGKLATVWSGAQINDPWGNMAVVDNGDTATLFVSMAGFDLPGPDKRDEAGESVTIRKATVLRLSLKIAPGAPPKVTSRTVVASGLAQRADKDVFLIGPTGLALIGSTLYVSDAVDNRVVAIPDALRRSGSAGTGRAVTQGGFLQRPLALIATPEGHLVTTNAKNGQIVEIDPAAGKQLAAQWVDANQAQQPPGNGDLFGLALTPGGDAIYYVQDDTNMLAKASK